jgi:hypothetical protein
MANDTPSPPTLQRMVSQKRASVLSNVQQGRDFQLRAKEALERTMGVPFDTEVTVPIGSPPKNHRFDLVSADRAYVGESKAFTWTRTGKIPSAKIATLMEATLLLSNLPKNVKAFIIMNESRRPQRIETLAEYVARLYGHLLGAIALVELRDDETLRTVRQGPWQVP